MDRFVFLANLMQVAWFSMEARAKVHGRDADAVRQAFDWGQLVCEVLFSQIQRTQAMWSQRIGAMVQDAEAKVPKVIMPAKPPEAMH